MFERSVRVPEGSIVTVHTPQSPWTFPGAALFVLGLIILGALHGGADHSSDTPRDQVVVAEARGTALLRDPAAGALKLRDLAKGQSVTVLCFTEGPESSGWGGTNNRWDRVKVGGQTGFVPDVAVNTHVAVDLIAPHC